MNKRRLLSFLSMVAAIGLPALTAGEPAVSPLPPDPVIQEVPARSSWNLNLLSPPQAPTPTPTPAPAAGPAAPPAAGSEEPPPKARYATEIRVVRYDEVMFIDQRYSDGMRQQLWAINGVIVQNVPGGGIAVSDPQRDPVRLNLADPRFAELFWVGTKTYRGNEQVDGKPAYHFVADGANIVLPPEPAVELEAPMYGEYDRRISAADEAWIDVVTRWPVKIRRDGALYKLQFNSPPTQKPQMPQNLRDFYNRYQAMLKADQDHRMP